MRINFYDSKLCLPRYLEVLPEDFDLLLYVVEIIGYDDHHLAIIGRNRPSDYEYKIPNYLSEKLVEFYNRVCQTR